MKVLQLGKFYPIRGGVEKVMYDLMMGLSETKVQCDMLCASTENHPAAKIRINAFATLFVVKTSLKLAGTMLAPAMILTLRRIASYYDIIHIHHPDPMAALALYLSGYKGTVVLHWHADILKQKTLLKFYKPLQNWLIERADKIVGTTPTYVKESHFLKDVQSKVDFVTIGVDAVSLKPDSGVELRKKYPNKILVFSLGRLVAYKGYAYLIEAAQKLDDRFHVIIGGKGPLQEQLSAQVRELKLENKVTLIGFVSDEQIPDYYAIADIFCLSSIWKTEAFAIVQIEAMSCAKPVISTNISGSGVSWVNAHDESGLVVEPENADALAQAIFLIGTDDQLYQKYARGGLQRYQNNFTREKMIEKCLNVYSKMLKNENLVNS